MLKENFRVRVLLLGILADYPAIANMLQMSPSTKYCVLCTGGIRYDNMLRKFVHSLDGRRTQRTTTDVKAKGERARRRGRADASDDDSVYLSFCHYTRLPYFDFATFVFFDIKMHVVPKGICQSHVFSAMLGNRAPAHVQAKPLDSGVERIMQLHKDSKASAMELGAMEMAHNHINSPSPRPATGKNATISALHKSKWKIAEMLHFVEEEALYVLEHAGFSDETMMAYSNILQGAFFLWLLLRAASSTSLLIFLICPDPQAATT